MAATICSDSARFTRGSFSPCAMRIGILMSSTLDSGERDHRKSLSSPTRLCHIAINGFQYSGNHALKVVGVGGPHRGDPPRERAGGHRPPPPRGFPAVSPAVYCDALA